MGRQIIDLSIAIESGLPSDPEMMIPKIDYLTHAQGADQNIAVDLEQRDQPQLVENPLPIPAPKLAEMPGPDPVRQRFLERVSYFGAQLRGLLRFLADPL